MPTDPLAFLNPRAASSPGGGVDLGSPLDPSTFGPVAAVSGAGPGGSRSSQPDRVVGRIGPVPQVRSGSGNAAGPVGAARQPGASGGGFLGSSLHSAKAATRLYIPVGLLAVTAGVLFVQARLAGRDPKLSRAPLRPDDDALSFRE